MASVVVYRIEDSDGLGPYFSSKQSDKLNKMLRLHRDATGRPGPKQEGLEHGRWHSFGFPDKDAMKKWFHGSRAELRRCGFKLCMYRVDETDIRISRSGKQLVFEKALAYCSKVVNIP